MQVSEDATLLREIVDWNTAFKGLAVHKPKYGIIVHGVSSKEVQDFEDEKVKEAIIKEWEESNSGLKIKAITKLRRKPRARSDSPPNQSIVVFTENPSAADYCIKQGFFINSLHRPKVERYAPELYITQCYKCHEFGHRAAWCKRKEKCGNCSSEDHATVACTINSEHRCCGCKGTHPAWAQECPNRSAEGRRLAELRRTTSIYFTS